MSRIRGCKVDEATVPTAASGSRASWEGPEERAAAYTAFHRNHDRLVYCPQPGTRSLRAGAALHPSWGGPASRLAQGEPRKPVESAALTALHLHWPCTDPGTEQGAS